MPIEIALSDRVLNLAPSATMGMVAKAKALKDKGVDVISFGAGEPNFETPQCIVDAAKRALDKGVSRYTAVQGTDELVSAIQKKFKRDQNLDYGSDQVMSSTGGKSVLSLAFDSLLGPGDEAIVFAPYWVSYTAQVELAGAKPVLVVGDAASGFLPNIEEFRDAITSKTKIVVMNSPNNPSGVVFPEALIKQIVETLEGTNIVLISDEIYEYLVYDDAEHVCPATLSDDAYERTLVVHGVAKAYAMTGWRVGIAAGPQKLIKAMIKLQSQRTTCVTSVAQSAAAYALSEPPELQEAMSLMRKSYDERRLFLLEEVKTLPEVSCDRPKGAFYGLLDVSAWMGREHRGAVIKSDIDLAERLLEEAHIALVPGTPFGCPGMLRLSLATSKEKIGQGLERMRQWLAK